MIHRFIDLLGERIPYWPIMVDTNNNPEFFWYVYTIGNGLTPFRVSTSQEVKLASSAISDPRLSPDETEIAYAYAEDPAFGSNAQHIRVVQADDSGSVDHVITDPIVPIIVQTALHLDWHPSGAKIAYSPSPAALTGTTSRPTVVTVNRDGTGHTTIWTSAVNSSVLHSLSYSASGDYIAIGIREGTNVSRVYVMEDDGSNPTLVFQGQSNNNRGVTPAWQRGADVLGFHDHRGATQQQWVYTCNADGSSLTQVFNDSSGLYRHLGRLAWLSDDSGMVCLKRTNGTTVFDATQWVVAVIDGAGGGATDTALSTGTVGTGAAFDPAVMVTAKETPRILYEESISGRCLVSVREDFSDYRIDFDPNDAALTDNETTDGWEGRSI